MISVDPTSSANEELYFTASHDAGFSFDPAMHVPREIIRGSVDIDAVAMDAEGLSVSIVWQEKRTWTDGSFPSSIHSAFSTDSGINWKPGFEISRSGGADARSSQIDFNYLYNNFICGWIADDLRRGRLFTPYGGRTEEFIFPLTNTLPRVLTLRCVAVGYNPLTIPHSFGKITDVVNIDLP